MVRRLFFLVILIVTAGASYAQQSEYAEYLSAEYVNKLDTGWRYHDGDNMEYASIQYNDSTWTLQQPTLNMLNFKAHFSGIGWFRLHFRADSALIGVPLALYLNQKGASEVYVDGRQIGRFGVIGDSTTSVYYDPKLPPRLFILRDTGNHVVAVRYANWKAREQAEQGRYEVGFAMEMVIANGVMGSYFFQVMLSSAIFFFFTTFFFAFALVHILLYLYQRDNPSNLWFSIFSFCISMLFLLFHVLRNAHIPSVQYGSTMCLIPLGLGGCFALSGLINSLFTVGRRRLKIIGIACLIVLITHFVTRLISLTGLVVMISIVSLEAVYFTVRAIRMKVAGARIIGTGILIFTLVILSLFTAGVVTAGHFEVNDTTTEGFLIVLGVMIAVLSVPVAMSTYLAWSFSRVSKNLKAQLTEVERLSAHALEQEAEKQRLLEGRQEELEREVAARTEELSGQKKKSDDLLLNILPAEVAEELKETGKSTARLYQNVSVLFTDFVDFTQMSEHLSPSELVAEIDTCFKAFDGIITKHGLEKIKTVGDAYIAVSGLPANNTDHAYDVINAALDICDFMDDRRLHVKNTFSIRLGVHSGPVVAGIVGIKKFAYDIWGDTVNTAARMEQHSEPGRLNISDVTYSLVKDRFSFEYRGELDVKHKGTMNMYFVKR